MLYSFCRRKKNNKTPLETLMKKQKLKKTTAMTLCTILVLSVFAPIYVFFIREKDDFVMPETMLVWAVHGGSMLTGLTLVEEWEYAVAREIHQRGGNFGVTFLPIGDRYNWAIFRNREVNEPWYTQLIMDKIEDGMQIDIISIVNNLYITDAFSDFYHGGMTLRLCDFLQSESGRPIYEKLPPAAWDSLRINGEIHGFFDDMTLGYYSSISICTEWLGNSGFDTSLLTNNLLDLIELLPEDVNFQFRGNALDAAFGSLDTLFNMQRVLPGIVLNNGEAINIYEHDYFYNHLLASSHFASTEEQDNMPEMWWGTLIPPNEPIGRVTSVSVSEPRVASNDFPIIINGQSDFTEEALQLFSWLLTDQKFADVFAYGAEGIHREYRDGKMTSLLGNFGGFLWANSAIGTTFVTTPPLGFEEDDISSFAQETFEYLWTLESAYHTGFRFDRRGWQEQIDDVQDVINRYQRYFSNPFNERSFELSPFALGTDPDWETTLASLNADLRAAGIGELIEEVQRQYDEWFALHSPVNR